MDTVSYMDMFGLNQKQLNVLYSIEVVSAEKDAAMNGKNHWTEKVQPVRLSCEIEKNVVKSKEVESVQYREKRSKSVKIQMTAKVIDDNGHEVTRTIEKEAVIPDIAEYGEAEDFQEIFHRYEKPALQIRNELAEDITKEYLERAASLKKYGEITGL